ncbi:acyltransferase [Neorhizobium galegae]|nr:acyltransferase [Neorhizobium galegae]
MTAPKMPRLLNLDILRLVSALMVLTFHYGFRMRISGEGGGIGFPELAPLAMWFDTGLLIFFAISGYVITMSAEGRSAYDFAAGRFARLWPTFIVCATITAVVLAVWHVPTLDPPTVRQWLAHGVIISRGLGQPLPRRRLLDDRLRDHLLRLGFPVDRHRPFRARLARCRTGVAGDFDRQRGLDRQRRNPETADYGIFRLFRFRPGALQGEAACVPFRASACSPPPSAGQSPRPS